MSCGRSRTFVNNPGLESALRNLLDNALRHGTGAPASPEWISASRGWFAPISAREQVAPGGICGSYSSQC
jgi:hypothetical protein